MFKTKQGCLILDQFPRPLFEKLFPPIGIFFFQLLFIHLLPIIYFNSVKCGKKNYFYIQSVTCSSFNILILIKARHMILIMTGRYCNTFCWQPYISNHRSNRKPWFWPRWTISTKSEWMRMRDWRMKSRAFLIHSTSKLNTWLHIWFQPDWLRVEKVHGRIVNFDRSCRDNIWMKSHSTTLIYMHECTIMYITDV